MNRNSSPGTLSFLLLGVVDGQPCSGYDLRRLFQDTPIGSFSDSPGSIYPALRALARRGLVRSTIDASARLRPRQVYRVTAAGRAALVDWLREPVVGRQVLRDPDLFAAKLAFMSGRLRAPEISRLAACHRAALSDHLRGVQTFARAHAPNYPLSARASPLP